MRGKNIVYSTALVMGLLLSGCGSSDSEGESRLSTQQMLDKGDFEGVIASLEGSTQTLTTDQNILLGMAYLGKSGATLTNIITLLDESGDSTNQFATFVTKLSDKGEKTALPDLSKSKEFFIKALGNIDCNNEDDTLTTSQKDICTFAGLSDTTKSALTVSYLLDKDKIDTFDSDTESDDKLTASTCAMAYAFDRTRDDDCIPFVEGSTVIFTQSQKTYRELTVTVNSEDYEFLLTDTAPQATVVTDGFCSNNDFTTRQDLSKDELFSCPVVTSPDEEEITAMDTLVETLNNGLDSIQAEEGSELADDIEEIRAEIATNGTIDEEDIIDYLNRQNNN